MKASWIWKVIGLVIVLGFIALGSFTSILQTDWGKKTFLSKIEKNLKSKNIQFSYQGLSGFLPFAWKIQEVSIITPNETVQLESVTFRWNLLGLFQKKILFRNVDAKRVVYTKTGGEGFWQPKGSFFSFPYSLRIKRLSIDSLEGDFPTLEVRGKASLNFPKKSFSIDLLAKRADFPSNTLELKARMGRNEQIYLQGVGSLTTLKALEPWFIFPFDLNASLNLELTGSFTAFQELLLNPKEHREIRGRVEGTISETKGLLPEFIQEHLGTKLLLSSHFSILSDRSLNLSSLHIKNPYVSLNMTGSFAPGFQFEKMNASFLAYNLSPIGMNGEIYGTGEISHPREEFIAEVNLKGELKKDRFDAQNIQMHAQSNVFGKTAKGSFTLTTTLFAEEWKAEGEFLLPEIGDLVISPLRIYSPFSEVHGKVALGKDDGEGEATFRVDDLYHFQPFFPQYPLYGGAEGKAHWLGVKTNDKWENSYELSASLYDLFFHNLHMNELKIDSLIQDQPKGTFTVQIDRLRYHTLYLNNVTIQTNNKEENWPFFITADGSFRAPLHVLAGGYWKVHNKELLINLQEFTGHLFNHPFVMPKPWDLSYSPNNWHMSDLELDLASSKLQGKADFSLDLVDVQMHLEHFPLDFLSLNPLDLDVQGFVSLDGKFHQKSSKAEGSLKVDIESIQTAALGENIERGSGFITADLKNDQLNFNGQILIEGEHIIEAKGEIPIEINAIAHSLFFPQNQPIQGEIIYNARAEEILDFINIGPHRFEGDVNCHLYFARTFEHPLIHGNFDIKNGTYENYYTGTNIKDIKAHLIGDKDTLVLESLSGRGTDQGTFLGQGKFRIDPQHHYPFNVHVEFSDMTVVDIPLVIAQANGAMDINGNKKSALAEGTLNVVQANFTIPEKLPKFIPSLDVSYINEPKPKTKERILILKKRPYPLHLQLNIHAPKNIFISGRGLTSEWQGDFKVGGTYDNIGAQGTLELMNGSFEFAGKGFNLVEGALTFTGEPSTPPYLDITGRMDQKGVEIYASLKGLLTGPHLTFRSTPNLPISAILSYLIFGRDISEISPIQAGQLAAVALNLAGQGPNIMEITKKTLGLDRLAVVTTPTKEGEEKPAVQVGKYLFKGILFSISQGVDPSIGNVSVEMDLTHGFLFEAQIIPQQEQGTFYLKWNMNY